MLAEDFLDEQDPNLDDDYVMLYKCRKEAPGEQRPINRFEQNFDQREPQREQSPITRFEQIFDRREKKRFQRPKQLFCHEATQCNSPELASPPPELASPSPELASPPPELAFPSPLLESGLAEKPLSNAVASIIINMDEDDLKKFTETIHVLKEMKIEITKFNLAPYLQNKNLQFENLLHYALEVSAVKISKYLIQNYPRKLFLDSYRILDNVGRIRLKTCLHIISEKNFLDLAKLIFESMKDKELIPLMNRKGDILEGRHYSEVSWFHMACYHGHIDIVKYCLEKGVSPDETDNNGESGLFWAVKRDEVSTAELLLNKKANFNLLNKSKTPLLYMAVRHNSVKCVKLIMEYPDVIAKREGVGFETPLILASACGYEEIVNILIECDADVAEQNSQGETAMHAAACGGWTKIMEMLYKSPKGSDTINALSKTKQTPLHYALAKNQLDATQFLAEKGANINLRDKHGKTILHAAITAQKWQAVCILLKTVCHSNWDGGESFLHLVAQIPNATAVFIAIQKNGFDMNTRDPGGNTYLHTAAKHGNISIIRAGLGIIDADCKNKSGNTPLHEAAKAGHLEAVRAFLRNCRLTLFNNRKESALHCAVLSPNASPEVVKEIVQHIKNTNSMIVLNAVNEDGNTALHLAAKFNRHTVVKHLIDISPSKVNKKGDSALHVAARSGNVETLNEMLNCFEYQMKINQSTEDGETLLHLVAKGGHVKMIGILIDYGINLAIQDDSGNTFLHDLAEQAGADPDNYEIFNDVFDEVIEQSLKWWCKVKNVMIVSEESDRSRLRREALWYLRSEIINNDGLTALQVAVKHGASSLVKKMIQVPSVFVQQKDGKKKYDVTNLVPDTFISKRKSSPDDDGSDSENERAAMLLIKDTTLPEGKQNQKLAKNLKPVKASLLEVVVSKRPLKVANDMLNIEPLKQVAEGYWMLYQLMTSCLLIIHVGYMSVLSTFAIPEIQRTMSRQSNSTLMANSTSSEISTPNPMFGLFLLWPIAMLLQEGYYVCNRIYRLVKKHDVCEPAFDEICSDPRQSIRFSDGALALFLYYLPQLLDFTFAVMVILWFQMYITSNRSHGIMLAYVMLIGWLSTIVFTRIFRPMHGFTIMLRNIFIEDVLKFLFLYVFILLAFGFAFDCLARLSPLVYSEFSTTAEVFYQTFGMLLDAGDIMVDNIEDKYDRSGFSPAHYKFMYMLYALVTVVVLLNILIAMMNDSYGDIKRNEGVSFRVLSIQQAIHFERTVPFLHKFFQKFRHRKQTLYQKDAVWYMEVEIDEPPKESKTYDRIIILHAINTKLDKLNQQLLNINSLRHRVDKVEQQILSHTIEQTSMQSTMVNKGPGNAGQPDLN